MRVQFFHDVNTGSTLYRAGRVYDVNDAYGMSFVREKTARAVSTESEFTIYQQDALRAIVAGSLSGVVFDDAGRVTAYTRSGVPHTIIYSGTSAVISNDLGDTRSVFFDGSGRVIGIT